MKTWLMFGLAAAVSVAVPETSLAVAPPASAKRPQISMAAAEKIAEQAFPGRILSEELEQEKGGSGLRYSFDIGNGKTVHEVGVDAISGKVLENDVDNDYRHPPLSRTGRFVD